MPVFARAIANPFSISIAPQIVTMMDGDINDEASIMEPYKKIFQKACIKFGGGKPGNVGKTCNKDLTLQALAEFYFDPAKGKMDPKAIAKWMDETTKDHDPSADGEWEVTAADMDEIVMKFVDLLKRTGVTPGGIKKTGTYLLNIGLPLMKRFYKPEDIEKMKMITSGQLMDVAKAKELLAGGPKGGELSLD